jgi:predicted Zn-dependent peptidase
MSRTKKNSRKNKKIDKKSKTHNKLKKHTPKHDKQEMKLYKNDSGTRLLVMPNRNETATASIYFFFKVGSKNETEKISGISHYIEHLIFKGSPKYPNYLDISKTFDANGISFNAYTSKDTTAYHYKFLSTKENMDIICKITSDMIMNPLMREKDIKTERNVIIQEYNDDIDDIDEYISEKIESCLLDGHPLGRPIIGTLKTINSINKEEIVEYHKKYYRPDNLLIGVSGRMHNDYLQLIEKYFGGKKSYKPISISEQGVTQIIPFVDKHPKFAIDCFAKDLNQDYIHIIFKTKGYSDPMLNYYKLLENILGGNMSSRLFVEIREKLGLVYSIKCDTTNYEEIGFFDIYTQNEHKDTLKCIDAIFKELIKIKENLLSDIELKQNKKNYCDIHKTNFDDIEEEIEHYSRFILTSRPIETLDMRINSIENITALDIQNVSRELFDFDKVHIITFGKIKKNQIMQLLKKPRQNSREA